jgi:hypothetical protein
MRANLESNFNNSRKVAAFGYHKRSVSDGVE